MTEIDWVPGLQPPINNLFALFYIVQMSLNYVRSSLLIYCFAFRIVLLYTLHFVGIYVSETEYLLFS